MGMEKSCLRNRDKVFEKISLLIDPMNNDILGLLGVKLEKREEYAIEYIDEMLAAYATAIPKQTMMQPLCV